jgi:hypothetical protein
MTGPRRYRDERIDERDDKEIRITAFILGADLDDRPSTTIDIDSSGLTRRTDNNIMVRRDLVREEEH